MSSPISSIQAADPAEIKARVRRFTDTHAAIKGEIRKVIVGQDQVIENLLISLFVGGHCLLTGMPGTAKTLLVRTLSRCLGLRFNRIQFTPDLMPSDITGTDIIEEDASGHRAWTFVPGPIFSNVLLADEINRTPPKTQSALLEAMQEFHAPFEATITKSNLLSLSSPHRIRLNSKALIHCLKRNSTASSSTRCSITCPQKKN